MNTEAQARELLRTCLLTSADAAGRYGLSEELALIGTRKYGLRSATVEDIQEEIQYLADKGFLVEVEKQISPENKSWRITATGRDWLANQGLA